MRRSAILPLVLVAALVGVGLWGYNVYQNNRRLVYAIDAQRHRAMADMVTHMQNIQDLLAKATVSGSPRQNIMSLTEIWRHAHEAQANLAELPLDNGGLQKSSTWLSQTAEYAYALAKRVARGQTVSDADLATLNRLHDQSADLGYRIWDLVQRTDRNRTPLLSPAGLAPRRVDLHLPGALVDGLSSLEKQAAGFPTLNYDGPFAAGADRTEPASPLGAQLSREQARAQLARWLPDIAAYTVTDDGDSRPGARIPFYAFRLTRPGGETLHADISQAGGWPIALTGSRRIGAPAITLDQARAAALEYLRSHGFANMAPTSQAKEVGGSAILSFVPEQDGVLIYPDSIKVKVAMDNGQVIGYDMQAYLLSHRPRSLPKPAVGREQAETALNGRLQVSRQRLALIPMPGRQEVLTYEFLGQAHDRQYLVYVNALTGDEEQILQVVNTAEGTLTM